MQTGFSFDIRASELNFRMDNPRLNAEVRLAEDAIKPYERGWYAD